MSIPSGPEQEVAETVRTFLGLWAQSDTASVENALHYVAEDFTGLGTGATDVYPDRPAMAALFVRETSRMPEATLSFTLPRLDVRLLRPDLALVECQIRSEIVVGGVTHLLEPRGTFVLERQDGRWLFLHVHFSFPDRGQEDGDTLVDTLERRTERLEREVAERTAELEQSLLDLRAAQARLVQSEKMASLGQLTAGIAHEIKNPLNFVTNFAGLSQELVDDLDTENDPAERKAILADLKRNAKKIQTHGRRADAIVRAMMEHARSGPGERRAVDLNGLVVEYADHALHSMTVRHPAFEPVLAFDLSEDIGSVEVAPQEIGRVLINLLDNAFGAVRQRADTERGGYTPTVTLSTHRTPAGAEIRVQDNGPGMSEAVRAKVFEPFFTTKPTGEGTGLGLSLSHDIVEQGHGGTMTVTSEEGAGATFTVSFPVA